MGTGGTPTAPLLIAQGAGGELEGTSGGPPGIGPGDGVMIAGDVRTLARDYCQRGVAVQYDECPGSCTHRNGGPVDRERDPVAERTLRRQGPPAELLADRGRQPDHADPLTRLPAHGPNPQIRP